MLWWLNGTEYEHTALVIIHQLLTVFLNINDFIHTALCCQVTFITASLLGTANAQPHGITTQATAIVKFADLRTATQYSSTGK
jgi:hypothetical protein